MAPIWIWSFVFSSLLDDQKSKSSRQCHVFYIGRFYALVHMRFNLPIGSIPEAGPFLLAFFYDMPAFLLLRTCLFLGGKLNKLGYEKCFFWFLFFLFWFWWKGARMNGMKWRMEIRTDWDRIRFFWNKSAFLDEKWEKMGFLRWAELNNGRKRKQVR